MGLHSFVAVDVETTGWDPGRDRLIEIGAVRFEGGVETACFSQLIDPGTEIPQRVQHLTGIHPQMVAGKPKVEAVLPALKELLGDLPLVAHNASFDLGFLQAAFARQGLSLANRVYDTAELSRVALPRMKNHRLKTLVQTLGLPLVQHHRAEDDARACGHLFLALLEQIGRMDVGLLRLILQIGEPGNWSLAPLFRAELDRREAAGEQAQDIRQWIRPFDGQLHRPDDPEEAGPARPIDPDQVRRLLRPGGLISDAFPAYEHRPQQLEMAEAVVEAFNRGAHLLMEAGTGTGKSLAYLLPAFAMARTNGERVAVSTHTITLQEQLWEKDIPFLQEALAGTELEGVKAALVKGRSNYVCLRKWEEAPGDFDLLTPEAVRRFHIRLASWLAETETGDRSELNLAGEEEGLWSAVMSETETCLGPKCPWYRHHCFAFRARRRAKDADLLVLNHALLFADMATGNQLLPPFRYLVADEAHHLEPVATQNLGINLENWDVTGVLNSLSRSGNQGILSTLHRRLGRKQPIAARPPVGLPGEDLVEKLIQLVFACRAAADELFRLCAQLVESRGGGEEEGGTRALRLTVDVRQGALWDAVDAARGNLVFRLTSLAQGLAVLGEELDGLMPQPPDLDSLLLEIAKAAGALAAAAKAVDGVLLDPEEGDVTWIEAGQRGEHLRVALRSAPINVGDLLKGQLFDRLRSVVMTSATLSVGGEFDHVRQRLGLSELPPGRVMEGILSSPFAYAQQALLLIPEDLPSPKMAGEREFTRCVKEFLRRYLVAAGGQTLVLFTSHRQLRQVYGELKAELEGAGLLLLGQGLDGSRSQLVAEFKEASGAVLFGSASFWEGVDIPGEGLSSVIMVRLPFQPPGDPVMEARIEDLERRGQSSFLRLSLPQAVIRFKQGFGRLVRTKQDRGVVIVLDSRLSPRSTKYGRQFLRSLPGPSLYVGPTDAVLARATAWLKQAREAWSDDGQE